VIQILFDRAPKLAYESRTLVHKGLRKANKAMRINRSGRSAFTLVEIMIVVAIIGLLAAIAIPNLVTARKKAQKQACISTLKAIDGAKANWALDMKKSDSDVPTEADLFGPDKYIETKPTCPAGGTYTLGAVREKPTCSIPEHALPQ
jgi:prepilin-type N-terminal cleavage/methylation domain-containing protein